MAQSHEFPHQPGVEPNLREGESLTRPRVSVIFPQAGVTIEAERINAKDIINGGTYLVDRDHDAHIILKPISDEPLPEGGWRLKEEI